MAIVSVLVISISLCKLIRYMIVDDAGSYTRVMMHEFYNQDNIDYLFCGASLCYRSFDPSILNEQLSADTFNVGSSSQDIDATYYIIKDAIRRYDINHIYLELSPIMAYNFDIYERQPSSMTGTYIIADYMKPSVDKFCYLLGASQSDYYIESFFIPRRNWQKIFDLPYIANVLDVKSTDEYKNYGYKNLQYENEWYVGKGYVESDIQVQDNSFNDNYALSQISIDGLNDDWFKYLNKIVKLCKDKQVELSFVCTPLSEYLLVVYGDDYDNYHDMLSLLARNNGIAFWDFNMIREDYMTLNAGDYMDSAHLNMYGARKFSYLLSRLINGELDYENISYDSVEDKLKNIEPNLCGIIVSSSEISIVSIKNERLEYQVQCVKSGGEEMIIQDFNKNNIVRMPDDFHGKIVVTTRLTGSDDVLDSGFYSY